MDGMGFVGGASLGGVRRGAAVQRRGAASMVATTSGRPTKFEAMRKKFGVPKSDAEAAGFSYEDFSAAVSEYECNLEMGSVARGRVFECTARGALIDIGAKAAAWLPAEEFSTTTVANPAEYFHPDTEMEFMVISREDSNGQLSLSLRRLEFQRCWDRVIQLQAEDVPVMVEVMSANRGGYLVKVEGLRGFVPMSQSGDLRPENIEESRHVLVKFLEVDPAKSRVVLSRKLAVASSSMDKFSPGQVVTGVVSGIKPYGLFVDVSGISGLLHISQISHDHIPDVGALMSIGEEVKAMVLNQDKNKGRMSLSTKVLEEQAGDMVRDHAKVFEKAEEMAEKYRNKLEEERRASAEVAEEIVSALDFARVDSMAAV